MAALTLLVLTATAAVLFTGGFVKLVRPGELRQTLGALGFPPALVTGAASAVPATEVIAGATVFFVRWAAALIVLLALAFAGAGLLAMRRGVQVECACFGRRGKSLLGKRQAAVLPLWLAAAAVGYVGQPDLTAAARWSGLFGALFLSAAWFGQPLVALAAAARQRYLESVRVIEAAQRPVMPAQEGSSPAELEAAS